MNRLTFTFIYLFFSLSTIVQCLPSNRARAFQKKDGTRTFCTPSSKPSCWPDDQAWQAFNQTINGNLIKITPWQNPCFQNPGPFNLAECEKVKLGYQNGITRAAQVGTVQLDNWQTCSDNNQDQNGSCSISAATVFGQANPLPEPASKKCQLGRLSPYAVNVQNAQDVQKAIQFANSRNIRMVIKNTGHEYLGRATAPDTLMIWTHNLQGLQFVNNYNGTGSNAVIMGSGTSAQSAYEFANSHGQDITLGAYNSVGVAGGFGMGGGHGPFGPKYGLAVDNILQYTIVTANGALLQANAQSNSDLYYALRGGGGGVWGVVTQVVYKVYPAKPIVAVVYNLTINPLLTQAQKLAAISNYVQQQALYEVGWRKKGWSGYTFITTSYILFSHFLPGGSVVEATADMAAFQTYLYTQPTQWVGQPPQINYFTNFQLAFQTVFALGASETPVAYNERLSSRLISVSQYATNSSRQTLGNAVANAYGAAENNQNVPANDIQFRAGSSIQLYSTGPLPAQFGGPSGSNTGVNPAWRDSIWEVLLFVNWVEGISVQGKNALATITSKAMDNVRPLGQGTYYSEADVLEPNWQQAFFGSNYNKLVSIKKKYDPNNVFTVWKGIGYEGQENQVAFQCYQNA